MSKRRVVVTGLGVISPVGITLSNAWENILAGKSGIRPITHFDTQDLSVKIAGTVQNFEPEQYIDAKDLKKMDTFIQYGIAAGVQAVQDAGLDQYSFVPERVGVYIGSGIGGLPSIERNQTTIIKKGPSRVSPFFVPGAIINMVAGNLSIKYGFQGPNLATVTACTSGTHSVGLAGRIIEYGDADIMIAGGAEMATTPLGIGGFAAAKALSVRNDDPEGASRPWDRDRDGFVLSEGAAILVLEEYEHAKKRGAKIYAELIGFGMSADAYHMTSPSPDGSGACACMENAIKDAGINFNEVNYINAHGTSTPIGDKAESESIKKTFGEYAYKLSISSTKSMTGHLLGAAGALEAVFSILAIRDQVAPPTINLHNPDPECDLDYIPHTAKEMAINIVLSNSFGFGGTNGTVIFRKI